MSILKIKIIIIFFMYSFLWIPSFSYANNDLSRDKRLFLARDFVKRMKKGQSAASSFLITQQKGSNLENILPDGEFLYLEPLLLQDQFPRRYRVPGIVTGYVKNKKILLSLKEFSDTLQLPIQINTKEKTASGWYIREHRKFDLDLKNKTCKTDQGTFKISKAVEQDIENNDILIPVRDLEQWLGLDINLKTDSQELVIRTNPPLPIQEHATRTERKAHKSKTPPSVLPRGDKDYQMLDTPVVDISTNTTYRKQGDKKDATKLTSANIRTAGDFAKGTLTTQTLYDTTHNIRNIRANYKRESNNSNLLGPLNARRFEAGDITPTRQSLVSGSGQELGIRITNTDPLRSFSRPYTTISGSTYPGWDVELYRGAQYIAFTAVGDDGFYNFDNVSLFQSDNNFKLVFYGPQGEVREESLYIPIDNKRLSNQGGIYDVSLSMEGKNTYAKKMGAGDEDEGTPNISALYEYPVIPGTALTAGFQSGERNGIRDYIAHTGVSTTLNQTLLNANLAIDDEAEIITELSARRNIGEHKLSNTSRWTSANFDSLENDSDNDLGIFKNSFRANGPIPSSFNIGYNPRYMLTLDYTGNTDGNTTFSTTSGLSTNWKYLNFNEQLSYKTGSTMANDTLTSTTTLSGNYKKNRMRLYSEYEVLPENELKRLRANYKRNLTNDIDIDVNLEHRLQQSLSELSAKLDWQAGFARISPSISYNSENDFFAGLRTRFSLLKEPHNDNIRFYENNLTSNGGVSAFVFLDKNGDGLFNLDDEPIENVVIKAPQNGGRAVTDSNGIALFNRMTELKKTDIILDSTTLSDPQWVSTFEGISVIPREGYIADVQFPVHLSGELEGTLYATYRKGEKEQNNEPTPLKNITLHLYNSDGEIEQSTVTDFGGFYYFSQIPPGRYLLMIDERNAEKGHFLRPDPQAIEFLYDGKIMYGNDLYAEKNTTDIPSIVKANLNDFKSINSKADFDPSAHEIVLNLGEYKSQLLMSLVWYRLQKIYKNIFYNTQLLVSPAMSIADKHSKMHTLRVGLYNESISEGYNKCHTLIEHGLFCKVEIFPAHKAEKTEKKQASL